VPQAKLGGPPGGGDPQVPVPGGASRQRVRVAVIVPAGPKDDVLDTLASVVRYTDPSRVILVVDDAGLGRTEEGLSRLKALSPDIAAIPAPAAPPGTFGGLWVKLSTGYRWILDRYDPGLVLRLDADALVIGPGLEAEAERMFASEPEAGLLGSYRVGPDNGVRDFSWAARRIRTETGPLGMRHPRMRQRLQNYRQLARRNGYVDGEHVLGAAYVHSSAAIRAIADNGWFEEARELGKSRIGDDHLISMLTVAAGFRIADFGGPEGPIAVTWRGLPAHPADLLAKGKLVTHSVRSWGTLTEQQIRALFAAARA
jgi:hypothetical protein